MKDNIHIKYHVNGKVFSSEDSAKREIDNIVSLKLEKIILRNAPNIRAQEKNHLIEDIKNEYKLIIDTLRLLNQT